jgi:4-diphosphocytidyl-2-C-methyl-D-erythritol kinase
VPRDESNTCYRIVEKAMTELQAKERVVIEIDKRLPVQGGLGGASANAVATLLGLERALGRSLTAAERLRVAAEVGSDLPLFLVGGTVLGVGRGEQVYPLADFPAMACVVVTPEAGVSTPKAFAAWDREVSSPGLKPHPLSGTNAASKGRSSTVPTAEPLAQAEVTELRSSGQPVAVPTRSKLTATGFSDRMDELGRGLSAWLSETDSGAPSGFVKRGGRAENPLLRLVRAGIENDFERVVFPEYPKLSEGKQALLRAGAKYASLSGSGSTLYGLFASGEAAKLAVVRLRKQGWVAQATVTLPRRTYWKRIVG